MKNEFIYTELYQHPLNPNKWCVIIKKSNIPPFIGTKKECIAAQKHAEKKVFEHLKNNHYKNI